MESSTDRVSESILKGARDRAKSIVDQAEKSADLMIENRRESARQSAEKDVYSLMKRAENEAAIIKGKVATDIKKKASWIVLSEKDRLVTNVLDEVKSRLMKLQKTREYQPVIEKLIVDAGTVLGGGGLEVVLNENDSSLPLKLNKLEKKIAEKTGAKTQLKLSKQQIKATGVTVKTSDGKIFVDNTFEAILKRRERELRLKIARILFGN